MKEQFKFLHGEEAPNSFMSGKLPIMGCFATSSIIVKAYFISHHHAYGSMGDHRLHVIDFASQSILGTNLPKVTKRSGRKLQWKTIPVRNKYSRDLIKDIKANKLDVKAAKIRALKNYETEADYCLACKSFDKVHCELQQYCEKHCRKYRLEKLEWSPCITEISVRLQIYNWIIGFKRGKKCNIMNLERACHNNLQKNRNNSKSKYCPDVMTLEEEESKLVACK